MCVCVDDWDGYASHERCVRSSHPLASDEQPLTTARRPAADVRETHKLVLAHIAAVRRIKNLADATIVLCLESNLAFECQVRKPPRHTTTPHNHTTAVDVALVVHLTSRST